MRPRGLCAFLSGSFKEGAVRGGGRAEPRSFWDFAGKKRLRSGSECGSAGGSGRSPPRVGDNEGAPLVIPTPPTPPIRSAPGPMPPDLPVPITRPRTLGAAGGRAEPAAPGTPPGRWEWEGGGPAAGAARIASPVQDRTRLCPRGAAGGCPRISFLPLPLTSLLCPSTYACRCHRYPAIRAAQLLPGFLPTTPPPSPHTKP